MLEGSQNRERCSHTKKLFKKGSVLLPSFPTTSNNKQQFCTTSLSTLVDQAQEVRKGCLYWSTDKNSQQKGICKVRRNCYNQSYSLFAPLLFRTCPQWKHGSSYFLTGNNETTKNAFVSYIILAHWLLFKEDCKSSVLEGTCLNLFILFHIILFIDQISV